MVKITDPPPPRREVVLREGPFDGETARVRIEGPTLRISKHKDGSWHRYVPTSNPDVFVYSESVPTTAGLD